MSVLRRVKLVVKKWEGVVLRRSNWSGKSHAGLKAGQIGREKVRRVPRQVKLVDKNDGRPKTQLKFMD